LHLNETAPAALTLHQPWNGVLAPWATHGNHEDVMAQVNREGQIVETAKEARQGERGPSVLMVLLASTGAIGVIFALLWYFFMR